MMYAINYIPINSVKLVPTALTLKHRHFNTAEAVDCGSGCSAIYVQNNSMCVLARTTAE